MVQFSSQANLCKNSKNDAGSSQDRGSLHIWSSNKNPSGLYLLKIFGDVFPRNQKYHLVIDIYFETSNYTDKSVQIQMDIQFF